MTLAMTIVRACARRLTRCVRDTPLALLALLLLLCLSAAPSFARSSPCAAVACAQPLTVSLSAEAADEEAEEGEEAGEEEGEEGGEASSEEDEEESASAEAEEEAEAEGRRRGLRRRHGVHNYASGGAIVLSKLRLTPRSAASLKHSPVASKVEFSFSLTRSMKVLVTLVKQGKPHAHRRWTALPGDSLTIAPAKGSSQYRLKARNHLSAGRYRLTLWPSHGKPRSIYVDVRG